MMRRSQFESRLDVCVCEDWGRWESKGDLPYLGIVQCHLRLEEGIPPAEDKQAFAAGRCNADANLGTKNPVTLGRAQSSHL